MISSRKQRCQKLLQANSFVIAPCRSIGKNDAIAFAQSLSNFDGAYGKSAETNGGARCFRTVRTHFKERDDGFGLAEGGAAYIENVFHVFDFDGAVYGEVGACASRERAVEGNINGNGAILNRRIDTGHMAVHDAVARVHSGFHAE